MQALKWLFKKQSVLEIFATIKPYKGLLNLALANDHLKLFREIQHELRDVASDVKAIKLHHTDEKRQRILFHISAIDFEDYHASVSSTRTDDTCGWLLESAEFTSWERTLGILFCRGIPGSGKTIFAHDGPRVWV